MVIEAGDRAQQEGVDALGRIQKNIVLRKRKKARKGERNG